MTSIYTPANATHINTLDSGVFGLGAGGWVTYGLVISKKTEKQKQNDC